MHPGRGVLKFANSLVRMVETRQIVTFKAFTCYISFQIVCASLICDLEEIGKV